MTKMISEKEFNHHFDASNNNENNNDFCDDIKVQMHYEGLIMVVYIQEKKKNEESIRYEQFLDMMRQICNFDVKQPFTLKWLDEEGDPCTLSSQLELDEAIRLYYLNKETELSVHVFGNEPEKPGYQCVGEDRSLYRRGARRWRKIYLVNGHRYQAKRFARTALCKVCKDKIWGLGRQGYKCLDCKIMVHKRCHRYIRMQCDEVLLEQYLLMNPHLRCENRETIKQSMKQLSCKSTGSSSFSKSCSSRSSTHTNSLLPINYNELEVNDSSCSKNTDEFSDNECENDQEEDENKENRRSVHSGSLASSLGKKLHLNKLKSIADDSSDRNNNNHRQMGLNDFDLIKVIGSGSYAKVFLVEYKRTRKCYAMKVVKKSKVNDDEDIDWVQTEKHIFELATNHPFLVGLHSCFQTQANLFYVIEYMGGGDLLLHMQRKCKLPEEHSRFYSAEIAVALDYLHSRGIIYRDLKLDNVLLDMDGHIRLTDYGMCKEGLKKGEMTSTFCGTPNYIPPEMLRGESYDFSVDWWALGVICFEMLVGRPPFNINENAAENPDLNTEDHLFQVILEKTIRIPRNLSARAISLLKGFLQKVPSDRLGYDGGLKEIQQHLFYSVLDWNLLEQRLIQPPHKPFMKSDRDTSNVDEYFTRQEVCLTPESPSTLARIHQTEFEGFEYVNPLILSEELSV